MTPSLILIREICRAMSPFLYPPPNNAPVIIYEDGGGLVDKYIEQAHRYATEGRRVEIRGSCRSACILALSVPNVCVTNSAQVKAHHAYEKESGVVRTDITNTMLAELPRNIRERLSGKIQKNYTQEATLNYSELRELKIPDCTSLKPTAKAQVPSSPNIKIKLVSPIEGILRIFAGEKK